MSSLIPNHITPFAVAATQNFALQPWGQKALQWGKKRDLVAATAFAVCVVVSTQFLKILAYEGLGLSSCHQHVWKPFKKKVYVIVHSLCLHSYSKSGQDLKLDNTRCMAWKQKTLLFIELSSLWCGTEWHIKENRDCLLYTSDAAEE